MAALQKPRRWKTFLTFIGGAGVLAALIGFTRTQTMVCGDYVLGRWPPPYFILGIVILVIGLTVLGLGLWLPEPSAQAVGQRGLAASLSIFLTLGLLDIALRLTDPPLVYTTPFYENSDQLGYYFVPNAQHRVLLPDFRYATFRTDSDGIIVRGESNAPQQDARRVIFLGDSFTEALQVMPEESASVIAEKVMQSQQKTQVINLGVSGYSPIQYLIMYRRVAPALKPQDVVVLYYTGNDVWDTARLLVGDRVVRNAAGKPSAIKPVIKDGMAMLDPTQKPIPVEKLRATIIPAETWHKGLLRTLQRIVVVPACDSRERARQRAELNRQDVESLRGEVMPYDAPCTVCRQWQSSPMYDSQEAIFKPEYTADDQMYIDAALDALATLDEEVKAGGGHLLIVIIPVDNQVAGQGNDLKLARGLADNELITSTAPQDLVLGLCQRESIDCLDLLPIFRAHDKENLYWNNETHLTPHGQALLGEVIAQHLLDEK